MKHPNDMTDQERNLAVAEMAYPFYEWFSDSKGRAFWKHIDGFIYEVQTVDYCNRWGDLIPLIIEHEIDLTYVGDLWMADVYIKDNRIVTEDVDPQIALVNCLILVLREKNNDLEL